ncbi:hypothetical protein E2562_013272 [Oryza meyeriana var. granulata]|uniref:Uncharacterized protein n=1 Tax=Oryza meyeriana var. granulata TaxID=110450 RepID=A0A6G1D385_9ORYZ|nr:hypothetical protein E2562_013272 [Oryza meyeriana var. granulata]
MGKGRAAQWELEEQEKAAMALAQGASYSTVQRVTIAGSSACCCGFPATTAGTTMCGRVASSRLAYTATCGSVSWCSCLDVASSFDYIRTAMCGCFGFLRTSHVRLASSPRCTAGALVRLQTRLPRPSPLQASRRARSTRTNLLLPLLTPPAVEPATRPAFLGTPWQHPAARLHLLLRERGGVKEAMGKGRAAQWELEEQEKAAMALAQGAS